jgi:hypothetical protein
VPRGVTKVSEVEMPDPEAPPGKQAERKHVQVVDTTTYRCR